MLPHRQESRLGSRPLMYPHMHRVIALAGVLVLGVISVAAAEPIIGVLRSSTGTPSKSTASASGLTVSTRPRASKLCLDSNGGKYRCGQKAAFALADFLDGRRPTSCSEVDRDRYKRVVAVCTAGGIDIAEWMVNQGHALDWPRYSAGAYAAAQKAASAAKLGMWSGSFARPWEWRVDCH